MNLPNTTAIFSAWIININYIYASQPSMISFEARLPVSTACLGVCLISLHRSAREQEHCPGIGHLHRHPRPAKPLSGSGPYLAVSTSIISIALSLYPL